MSIGRIQPSILLNLPHTLWVGRKVRLEVISNDRNGNGIIILAGKQIPAKIEAAVNQGDRFTAIVKEITPEGVVLARITPSDGSKINHLVLAGRGFPVDENLARILRLFAKGQWNLKPVIDRFYSLNSLIPRWESITSSSSYALLCHYFSELGLDYEQRLFKLFRHRLNPQGQQQEVNALRTTVKSQLLQQAGDNKLTPSTEGGQQPQNLSAILAQQLWLSPGDSEHAYLLFNFPFYDGPNLREARIAVESARKGMKVDVAHCHIGIEIQTENLGIVGADVWIFEDQIHIKILCDNLHDTELDDDFMSMMREQFAKIGLKLMSFQVSPFAENKGFERFVRGEQGNGVDLHG